MSHKAYGLQKDAVSDQWLFWGVLAVLVWAPLPIGSNRMWASGILLLLVFLLLVGASHAWRHHGAQLWRRVMLFKIPLGLLGAMVTLAWLQVTRLPASWVSLLSPKAALAQAPAQWMTLSLDVYQSMYMASLSFVYFSMFLLVVLTVRTTDRLEKLAQVLVFSGVLQTVIGSVLYSIRAEYQIFYAQLNHSRMIGTFVYHNSLAAYLYMCLSMGIGLMLSRLSNRSQPNMTWKSKLVAVIEFVLSSKMRLRLLLIVMVIGLVLTRSRMGNTAFFAAMLVVGLTAMVLAKKTAPKTIKLIASLIIIDVLVIGTWVGLERVVERIQDTEVMIADGGKSESIEARSAVARMSLPIIMDYPLFGTGGGSFYGVFLNYATKENTKDFFDHTHNDFVEIAVDFGLIGFCVLGLLAGSTLWTAVRVMAKRQSPLPWGIAFGVAMSIVALLIHSSVDFSLQITANALTIVVILAMGWLAHTLPSSRSGSRSKSKGLTHETP